MPPVGSFDARFASQRMVEILDADRRAVDLVLSSVDYPVTVSVDRNETGDVYAVAALNGRGEERVRILRGNGASGTFTEAAGGRLSLRLTGESTLPAVFALGRSYPNPFNPVTRFTVDVPVASPIEVAVFNVLGQKIATLFSGVREAGSAQMAWNGLSDNGVTASSGVYFIRMTAAGTGFTATQKVSFLK